MMSFGFFQCSISDTANLWSLVGKQTAVLCAGGLLENLPAVGTKHKHPRTTGCPRLLPGTHRSVWRTN
jgi:hypothetical protein